MQAQQALRPVYPRGSYVPNLVKIGPWITSQFCPQTPDGRTELTAGLQVQYSSVQYSCLVHAVTVMSVDEPVSDVVIVRRKKKSRKDN